MRGTGATNAGIVRRFLLPFESMAALNQPTSVRFVRPRLWRSLPLWPPTLRLAGSRRTEGAYRSAASPTRAGSHDHSWSWGSGNACGRRGAGAIQAGLIVTELQARGMAEQVLILTPAGLREQWATELSRRFAISASLVDFHDVRHRLATLPIGSNPWSTVPVAIASIDYVKRPEILHRCSRAAGTFSQ